MSYLDFIILASSHFGHLPAITPGHSVWTLFKYYCFRAWLVWCWKVYHSLPDRQQTWNELHFIVVVKKKHSSIISGRSPTEWRKSFILLIREELEWTLPNTLKIVFEQKFLWSFIHFFVFYTHNSLEKRGENNGVLLNCLLFPISHCTCFVGCVILRPVC